MGILTRKPKQETQGRDSARPHRRTSHLKATDARKAVPSQPTSSPYLSSSTRRSFPNATEIEDDEYRHIASRVLIAAYTLERKANDCFDKWYDVESDTQTTAESIAEFDTRLNVQQVLKTAWKFKEISGYSLITIQFIGGDPDLSTPIENPAGIASISAVQKKDVQKMVVDTEPTSDTYGQVLHYEIDRPKGNSTERIKVHASRCIHWVRPSIDNSLEGASFFQGMYNALQCYDNMMYAVGETMWQNVSPFRVLKLPDWIYEHYDETEQDAIIDEAMTEFQDLNCKQTWALLPGYEIEVVDTDKGMNIQPHLDFIENQLSAAGIPKYLMQGIPQGKLTGSEINRDEYYKIIENEQQNDIEHILLQLHGIGFVTGDIKPEADYSYLWTALKSMSRKELAEIEQIEINNAFKQSITVKQWVEAGMKVSFVDGEIVVTDPEGNNFEVEQDSTSPRKHAHPPRVAIGTDKKGSPGYEEANEKVGIDTKIYERMLKKAITPNMLEWETEWIEQFSKMFDTYMNTDSAADVQKILVDFEVDNPKLKAAMKKEYRKMFERAGDEHNNLMIAEGFYEFSTTFDPADVEAMKWLESQADLRYTKTVRVINDQIKEGLNELLSKGISVRNEADISKLLRKLETNIATSFSKYDGKLATMIRTETAKIVMESRVTSYEQNGVETVEILVSSDACPICQELVGSIYHVSGPNPEALPPAHGIVPVHPNCTCDMIPIIAGIGPLSGEVR